MSSIFILVSYFVIVFGQDNLEKIKFIVEHTFDEGLNPVFEERGTIIVHSIKSGKGEFVQQKALLEKQLDKLKNLSIKNGIYRIRIFKDDSSISSKDYVYSYTKACSLFKSNLSDKMTIHLDSQGNLLGGFLSTNTKYCSNEDIGGPLTVQSFDSFVEIQQTVAGPLPETELYIKKLEIEKQQKQNQNVDNRSFLVKYWMYILPVFLLMMVFNSMDPNTSQGR